MKKFENCVFEVISLDEDIITASNFNGNKEDVVTPPGENVDDLFGDVNG